MNTDRLRELNEVANDGRGSSTVRGILQYLDAGDVDNAQTVWEVDGDKLRQYPELLAEVVNLLGCRLHFVRDCPRCSMGS